MTEAFLRPPGMQTALYRFFNADGTLLYVGIANDPRTRWSCHAGEKRWWDEVEAKTVTWFATREEAEGAEMAAIVSERPLYNVTHSETRRPGDARDENTGRYGFLAKIRMRQSMWVRFGQAAEAAGTNRSAVILAFMAWYMQKPGAKRPQRPPAGPWSSRRPGEAAAPAVPPRPTTEARVQEVGPKATVPAQPNRRTETRHHLLGRTCHHFTQHSLTCDQYDELLARAAGHCELCGLPESETGGKRLVVDHFQGGGVYLVRGLICDRCNSTMSCLDENKPWGPKRTWETAARAYEARSWQQATLEQMARVAAERERRREHREQIAARRRAA